MIRNNLLENWVEEKYIKLSWCIQYQCKLKKPILYSLHCILKLDQNNFGVIIKGQNRTIFSYLFHTYMEQYPLKVSLHLKLVLCSNHIHYHCTISKGFSLINTGCPTIGVPKVKLYFSLIFQGLRPILWYT